MVKYIVTGSKVVFGTGLVLGLSDEQAKTRSLQLKKSGTGRTSGKKHSAKGKGCSCETCGSNQTCCGKIIAEKG